MASRPAKLLKERGGELILGVSVLFLLAHAADLALHKGFSIDEFDYAHRTWTHTRSVEAFVEQIAGGDWVHWAFFAPFVLLGESRPSNMVFVRYATLASTLVTLGSLGFVASRLVPDHRLIWAGLAVVLAVGTNEFIRFAVEIRPDSVAFLFLALTLVALFVERPASRTSHLVGGLCLYACAFANIKGMFYGSVFLVPFALSLRDRPFGCRPPMAHPWWFAGGFSVGLSVIGAAVWWEGGISFLMNEFLYERLAHEDAYPGFSPLVFLGRHLESYFWLWGLAGVGSVSVLQRWWRNLDDEDVIGLEFVVPLLLVSSLGSFVVQTAPYPYSLIPCAGVAAILASVGVRRLVGNEPFEPGRVGTTFTAGSLLVVSAAGIFLIATTPKDTNERQIELQEQIGSLTDVTDAAWGYSPTYAYRPRGFEFPFVDSARKETAAERLDHETPEKLFEHQTVLFAYDIRFHKARDSELSKFISTHYQRYNNDIFLWGRKWTENSESWNDDFRAIQSHRYFVFPESALERGELRIDGETVEQRVVRLERGSHDVGWKPTPGESPVEELFLVWLPRTGEAFDPTREAPPFHLGGEIFR